MRSQTFEVGDQVAMRDTAEFPRPGIVIRVVDRPGQIDGPSCRQFVTVRWPKGTHIHANQSLFLVRKMRDV